MAVVFARWREELPYRWLWIGFVIFISACGLSHLVHALHALTDETPHAWPELIVLVGTATVSLVTAGGFTYLLPKILRLSSPAQAKRRLEAAVEAATADLHRALEHERLLLLEVHHRVKNNLQVTASLISLHMKRTSGQAGEMRALRERIMAIAAVHGQLQEVGSVDLRARGFIETLARSLTASGSGASISVGVTGDDFVVKFDHAASFALIIHEVLSNALRHAFPDGKEGSIEVLLECVGAKRKVTIIDNGVGMRDGPEGIGKVLVKALAVQLAASVGWRAGRSGGAVFILEFEDDKPAPPRSIDVGVHGGIPAEIS